ncbi:peptidoglycan-binding domain-containing protein [Bacillus nitratireducens]|uniref:peptidoglycan-binding domain-containing protein n=1 Tax=Bacillus nitratireducens TaxID=2026193 RepID=UPI002E1C6A35|nr:peptidoglycan-binding domain-containing protein [Bacillus nitratireducens]
MKKWNPIIRSNKKRINTGWNLGKSIGTLVLTLMLLLLMTSVSLAVGKDAHGPDVFVIQGMLKSLGSYEGKINGHYDKITVQGVKYFQKQNGLGITGSVYSGTFQSIMYAYSNLKFPSAPGGKGKGPGAGEEPAKESNKEPGKFKNP